MESKGGLQLYKFTNEFEILVKIKLQLRCCSTKWMSKMNQDIKQYTVDLNLSILTNEQDLQVMNQR